MIRSACQQQGDGDIGDGDGDIGDGDGDIGDGDGEMCEALTAFTVSKLLFPAVPTSVLPLSVA